MMMMMEIIYTGKEQRGTKNTRKNSVVLKNLPFFKDKKSKGPISPKTALSPFPRCRCLKAGDVRFAWRSPCSGPHSGTSETWVN